MSRVLIDNPTEGTVDSIGLPCCSPVWLLVSGGEVSVRTSRDGRRRVPVLAPLRDLHILLAPPRAASVMGLPLLAGTCRLADGDVITCEGATIRYATRDFVDPTRLEPLVASEEVRCAACMSPRELLRPGDSVTYCPACRWAFHAECLAGGQLAACPICANPVCITDGQKLAFARQHEESVQS